MMECQISDEGDKFEELQEGVGEGICDMCFETRKDGFVIEPVCS